MLSSPYEMEREIETERDTKPSWRERDIATERERQSSIDVPTGDSALQPAAVPFRCPQSPKGKNQMKKFTILSNW